MWYGALTACGLLYSPGVIPPPDTDYCSTIEVESATNRSLDWCLIEVVRVANETFGGQGRIAAVTCRTKEAEE